MIKIHIRFGTSSCRTTGGGGAWGAKPPGKLGGVGGNEIQNTTSTTSGPVSFSAKNNPCSDTQHQTYNQQSLEDRSAWLKSHSSRQH